MNMKKATLVLLTILISAISFSQGWKADKNHSRLGFEVTHLMVTNVDGYFKSFNIDLNHQKMIFQMLQ